MWRRYGVSFFLTHDVVVSNSCSRIQRLHVAVAAYTEPLSLQLITETIASTIATSNNNN